MLNEDDAACLLQRKLDGILDEYCFYSNRLPEVAFSLDFGHTLRMLNCPQSLRVCLLRISHQLKLGLTDQQLCSAYLLSNKLKLLYRFHFCNRAAQLTLASAQ